MGCRLSKHFKHSKDSKTFKRLCNKNSKEENCLKPDSSSFTNHSSTGSFLYDINISCHNNQLDWVESHLLPLLEKKLSLKCFLFERDKRAGGSHVNTIKESILCSRKTIICFTSDYIGSTLKQYEAVMAHYVDPAGTNKTFIPLLLEECDLPEQYQGLAMIHWPGSHHLNDRRSQIKLEFFWKKLLKSLDLNITFQNVDVV